MGKPFSDLEKRALAILANNGDPAQSKDRELARYWEWRLNPADASHDLPEASTRTEDRKLDDYGIIPFGIDLPASTYAKATMSKRSFAVTSQAQQEALGLEDLVEGVVAYRLARFSPAKVYWRTGAANTPVQRTSRITGRKYKSYYDREDEGYTAPFGRKLANDRVSERQAAIRAAIQTENSNINLLSFSPEKARN